MESTVAECILDAATVEFARTGLAGARMARIADIGARHPTVARLLMHDLLVTGARRRGRPSLRNALRETATTLHAWPFFRLHGTTERAIVMIEVIIAAWLLAGAVSGRAGRIYADSRSSSG